MDATGTHRIGVEAAFEPNPAVRYGAAAILFFTVDEQGSSVSDRDPQALAELQARIPLGADATVVASNADQANASSICVDVIGRVMRIAKVFNGATLDEVVIPITAARVELWESDPIFDDHDATVVPDANGDFIFRICTNDGFFDDTLEFYIKVVAEAEGAPDETIAEVRYFKQGPNNRTATAARDGQASHEDGAGPDRQSAGAE